MSNILYAQNESANKKNTIIIDGEIFSEINEGNASAAFKFINKKSGEEGNFAWLVEQLKKRGKISSRNFKFIKDSSGIFIKACFKEKDELGRNMPFLFYTDTTEINRACDILNEYASKISRTCFDNEIKMIKYLSDKVVYGIGISIVLLIIGLWKIASN